MTSHFSEVMFSRTTEQADGEQADAGHDKAQRILIFELNISYIYYIFTTPCPNKLINVSF